MTTQQTAAICNRHIDRLMTDLESLGCSAEVKNTVRTEMRWLRNDLTKDGPFKDGLEASCNLLRKFMPWIGKPSAKRNARLAESALDMLGER